MAFNLFQRSMMFSGLISVLLAVFALSLIIFLHEMGHLLAALAVKMKVNVFSIGFGPVIRSWKWRDIDWRLSWIPLGGYVSIQGMDDDQTGPGSYYAAPVYKRIIVIAMGPIVNILLAWAFFAGIYMTGGLPRSFAEITNVIGWIDQKAPLVETLEPGDRILAYDGKPFSNAKDNLYFPMLSKGPMVLDFEKVNYAHGIEYKGQIKLMPYSHPEAVDPSVKTVGILSGARFLTIEGFSQNSKISEYTLAQSGALVGDQIVAVNGKRIFSDKQLLSVLNQSDVWLGIERNGQIKSYQIPLITLSELSAFPAIQLDWRDALFDIDSKQSLVSRKVLGIDMDPQGYVEFICFPELAKGLEVGDKIISVNGVSCDSFIKISRQIQSPKASVVVYRQKNKSEEISFEKAQESYFKIFSSPDLESLLENPVSTKEEQKGDFVKLKTCRLLSFQELGADQLDKWKESANLVVEEATRQRMLKMIEEKSQEKVLGVRLLDANVLYNPTPNEMMLGAINQITLTLNALLTGQLSPKWIAGPVGMVTVMSQSFAVDFKQALYWLAMISLNLGLFNLLPLPIFDGGRIILETIEGLTGKRIPSGVMEFLTYTLVIGLIGLSIVATYWDISRLATLWGA